MPPEKANDFVLKHLARQVHLLGGMNATQTKGNKMKIRKVVETLMDGSEVFNIEITDEENMVELGAINENAADFVIEVLESMTVDFG